MQKIIISVEFIIYYCSPNAEDELCKIEDRDDELCVAKSSVRSVGSAFYFVPYIIAPVVIRADCAANKQPRPNTNHL